MWTRHESPLGIHESPQESDPNARNQQDPTHKINLPTPLMRKKQTFFFSSSLLFRLSLSAHFLTKWPNPTSHNEQIHTLEGEKIQATKRNKNNERGKTTKWGEKVSLFLFYCFPKENPMFVKRKQMGGSLRSGWSRSVTRGCRWC